MVIRIPKGAFSKYRPAIKPCDRCDAEFPIAEEDKEFVYIEYWQGKDGCYCCEEHMRLN